MDKALEKINELEQKLEKLYIEKDNIEDKIDFKNEERINVDKTKEKLNDDLKYKKYEKDNIQYKLNNIKKWKKRTILKTTLIAIVVIITIILANLNIYASVLGTLISLAIATPLTILLGEDGCYYYNKKYLKKYKLEDVEKEIAEKENMIVLNNKKLQVFDIQIAELLNIKDDILSNINDLESKINNIKNIRATVIEKYIENNQELDTLINREFEKENNKLLVKKKDSNE